MTGKAAVKPLKIEQISAQVLVIEWDDGKNCVYYTKNLRANCPCAVCAEARKDKNPLKVLSFDPEKIELVNWRMVGRYAIAFEWSDAHDTGIYTYDFLREMCMQGKG
jgi:DUF971 family protein